MSFMDVRSLEVFVAAAQSLNFTEAGRTLGISQPAVSQQIQSLEDYMGVNLFKRSRVGLRLTTAGESLLPLAEEILIKLRQAEAAVRSAEGSLAGDLLIGVCATVGMYILPHIVARFRALYPDIHVLTSAVEREILYQGIASGDLDLGITDLRLEDYPAQYQPLFTDRLVLVAPRNHPWVGRHRVSAHELLDEAFICRESASACRAAVGTALAEYGIGVSQLHIVMEVPNADALAMAVEHGVGLSFVSLLTAMPRVKLGRLAIVQMEDFHLKTDVEIVSSAERGASPAGRAFCDFVRSEEIQDLVKALAEGEPQLT